MNPKADLIFWAERWAQVRAFHWKGGGIAHLARMNYMLYLTHVFSWIMEEKEKQNVRD